MRKLGTARAPTRLRIGNRLEDPDSKRELNKRLFSKIAVEYRWMPAALSLGRDSVWKRHLIQALPDLPRPFCVDLACGDGDLTRRIARRFPEGSVLGLDLTPPMISRAQHFTTQANIHYAEADMGATGLASESADIVTGGYALRNAPELDETIREIARILRPGGWAGFLEFMRWPGRIGGALEIGVLRVWGGLWGMLLHGNPAVYGYIAASLRRFPIREELVARFAHHGFRLVNVSLCFFGVTAILLFRKDGQRKEASE